MKREICNLEQILCSVDGSFACVKSETIFVMSVKCNCSLPRDVAIINKTLLNY